jgi:D-arabinose 1-dehydrogenase-like Zn-dependent alcohol dehydrogenase
MHSVQVSKPKGPFEIVERDIPEPGPMKVRIKVQACGICQVRKYFDFDKSLFY